MASDPTSASPESLGVCLGELISDFANGVKVSPKPARGVVKVFERQYMLGTIHMLGDRLIIQMYSNACSIGSGHHPVIDGSPLSTNFGDAKLILKGLFGHVGILPCSFIPFIDHRKLNMGFRFDDQIVEQITDILGAISRVEVLAKHPLIDGT